MSEARNLLRVYQLFRRWRSGVKEEGLAISTEPEERALTCSGAGLRMAGNEGSLLQQKSEAGMRLGSARWLLVGLLCLGL